MGSSTDLLRRLRPHTFRARIVLAILLALALTLIGTEVILRSALRAQVRDSLHGRLQVQADALVSRVERFGVPGVNEIIPVLPRDLYIRVAKDGTTIRYSGRRRDGDVFVTAVRPASGLSVTLGERPPRGSSSWLVATLVALGIGVVGGVVWFASGALAARLRRSAGELAGLAENIASGDLTARAPELDDELGRLAGAMNGMAERLQSADQRQREFLADAAHELRTPVTAIEGFAEALVDGTASTEEDRTEAAAFIRDEAARLGTLIRQLQEVTWHDLDAPVAWQQTDFAALGREAAARFEGAAAELGITITGPTGTAPAVADPEHVETILGNLIRNALRATPSGGRVEVSAGRDATCTWLRVADTGHGIAQEHLPYIFDRLFRVGPARDRTDGDGSGLGLAIVRRLAQRMGGRVTVQSAPGEGAAFTLRIPRRTGWRGGRIVEPSREPAPVPVVGAEHGPE